MSILCLDLDETLWAAVLHLSNIHEDTVLSKESIFYSSSRSRKPVELKVINPIEISDLIERAYREYDGVMILTAGCWDRVILKDLTKLLDISPEVEEKFISCKFHSAVTDAKLFGLDVNTVAHMDKHTRLKKIIARDNELKNKQFVMLDNDEDHVDSFEGSDIGLAVLADTTELDTHFYNLASKALEITAEKEKSRFKAQQSSLKRAKENIPSCSLNMNDGLNFLFFAAQMDFKTSLPSLNVSSSPLKEISNPNGFLSSVKRHKKQEPQDLSDKENFLTPNFQLND